MCAQSTRNKLVASRKVATNVFSREHKVDLLTIVFAGQIVFFANEFVFVQDVELFAGGELLPADHAGEAFEVEHFAPRSPHQVVGTDALRTTSTFGSETPERRSILALNSCVKSKSTKVWYGLKLTFGGFSWTLVNCGTICEVRYGNQTRGSCADGPRRRVSSQALMKGNEMPKNNKNAFSANMTPQRKPLENKGRKQIPDEMKCEVLDEVSKRQTANFRGWCAASTKMLLLGSNFFVSDQHCNHSTP